MVESLEWRGLVEDFQLVIWGSNYFFLRLALAGGWTKIIFKLRILLEELSVVSLISRLVFNQTPEILK